MHKEDQRYQSFSQDWPHPLQNFGPTPVKLAKSGFYLSPTVAYKDRVVCFCCGIALVNWQKDHDPWYKKKHLTKILKENIKNLIFIKGMNMAFAHPLVVS